MHGLHPSKSIPYVVDKVIYAMPAWNIQYCIKIDKIKVPWHTDPLIFHFIQFFSLIFTQSCLNILQAVVSLLQNAINISQHNFLFCFVLFYIWLKPPYLFIYYVALLIRTHPPKLSSLETVAWSILLSYFKWGNIPLNMCMCFHSTVHI